MALMLVTRFNEVDEKCFKNFNVGFKVFKLLFNKTNISILI